MKGTLLTFTILLFAVLRQGPMSDNLPPLKTNMTNWNITIFFNSGIRLHLHSWWDFPAILTLVFGGI